MPTNKFLLLNQRVWLDEGRLWMAPTGELAEMTAPLSFGSASFCATERTETRRRCTKQRPAAKAVAVTKSSIP